VTATVPRQEQHAHTADLRFEYFIRRPSPRGVDVVFRNDIDAVERVESAPANDAENGLRSRHQCTFFQI
jgi:hypothetical protein